MAGGGGVGKLFSAPLLFSQDRVIGTQMVGQKSPIGGTEKEEGRETLLQLLPAALWHATIYLSFRGHPLPLRVHS